MKIAVLGGAGGMGAAFGVKLAGAGHDVTLLDVNQAAVDAINKSGVTIELKSGEKSVHKVKASTNPSSLGGLDLVINFVKCYHTEPAIKSVLPALGQAGAILSLQNGWGNAPVIAGLAGEQRVFMGVTYHSATVLGPGHVLHAGQGPTYMGPLAGEASRAKPYVEALIGAGLEVTLSEDVRKDIFQKVLLNICTLPTSALLRFGACQLVEHEGTKALMRRLLEEGVKVVQAQGIAVDVEERWSTITGLLGRVGMSKSSMLQDVEAQRRTEIDVINGAIVAMGKQHGVATPSNQAMVDLVKSLEETFGRAPKGA
jgi:2-dehydropantoate 2-reductase